MIGGKSLLGIKISNSKKLRILHLVNHVALIYGIFYGAWWMWLVSLVAWNFIGSIGISIGFHRLLSHQSFKSSCFFEKFASLIGCFATGGSTIAWVGSHRLHHMGSDQGTDPHSPSQKGFLRVYLHLWGKVYIPRKLVRDLLKSRFHCFLHRYYFHIVVSVAFTLYLIDPFIGIFVYSIPSVIAFHAFGLINTLCHSLGDRNYDTNDSSTNNWFVNLWTCGEGWHNNHHRYPSSYRIGLRPHEVDLSAFIIELFRLDKNR